ncbi:MAG: hypothetical protein ACC628_01610, partial [Pirellulaceae bacterium]
MHARIDLVTLAFSVALVGANTAHAEDFRVDTDVFLGGGAEEPVAETLTLFSQGLVYDFILNGSEEITIFDVNRGNVVLLDTERRMMTSLTTEQLLEFSAKIKTLAQGDEWSALFFPQFDTQFDAHNRQLELVSPNLTYRVTGIRPKMPGAARQFRQFADWYARLNAIRPGNLPPFARLELNRALEDRELVPQEVDREIVIAGRFGSKELRARSIHSFVWMLSGTDRKRVEKASRLRAEFAPAVSL